MEVVVLLLVAVVIALVVLWTEFSQERNKASTFQDEISQLTGSIEHRAEELNREWVAAESDKIAEEQRALAVAQAKNSLKKLDDRRRETIKD